MTWCIGGGVAFASDLEVVGNTTYKETARNVKSACKRDIPWLERISGHDGTIAIVGGGPSLSGYLSELRQHTANGMRVIATNGAHDYLVANGITPDFHLIIDARPENAHFVTKPANAYFLASQCAPILFELAGDRATLLHMNTAGIADLIPPTIKPIHLISSGSTVGLAGIAVAYVRGYRKIYLYGMDSSYEDTRHAYPQALNNEDRVIDAVAGGRTFKCAPWMVAQVEHFQTLAAELAEDNCELHVRCDGLLGHVAWLMTQEDQSAIPAQHAA